MSALDDLERWWPAGFMRAPEDEAMHLVASGNGTETDGPDVRHRGGVWWHEAPLPRRWHRCRPQTVGWVNLFTWVERCACGAIKVDNGVWHNKNQTRKAQKR